MNLIEEIFGRLKYHSRARSLVVMAICCCICINGFAQLVYLTDSRSISGSASASGLVAPPVYYTVSYSGYSGSATPSAPFADFQGGASGTAIYVGGFSNPINGQVSLFTNTATITDVQKSFLHSQELYFNSSEFGSGSPSSANGWSAQALSSLKVTFSVSDPVTYNLIVQGLGDPIASFDSYNLSSANQGVLASGDTRTMIQMQDYGNRLSYSGTFNPGDVYTLTLESQGGANGPAPFGDGGGLLADLVVPEPSMTALAGLAFLIFLLRPHRMRQRRK
jgi:hypothetical protein